MLGWYIGAATMENSMNVFSKDELPNDPAIALLGIYPKNIKTLIGKDVCYSSVDCSIIYNNQYMQTTIGSIDR